MPGLVNAQQPGFVLPRSAEPDIRLDQLPPTVPDKPAPEVEVLESAPSRAPAGADKVRFLLNDLIIEGVTVYPPDVIENYYGDLLGTEVSLAAIYDVAAKIQLHYRQDDYFLTRVILPAQKGRHGQLLIRVFEGYISDVLVEGEIGPVQQRVSAYLENLPREKPLKLKTLERYLLLSRDIPGVDVNGVLRPSPDELGAAQLVATVERKSFDALAVVDNIGSTFTEEWEAAVSVSSNSFSSLGERVTLTGLVSDPLHAFSGGRDNQKVAQLSASFLLGSEGMYSNFLASYGDSNPGDEISQFDFESKKLLLSGLAGYPFIRTRDLNLSGDLGFDYINSDTDIFDNTKYARDRLRVLHIDGELDFRDKWRGSTFLTASLRHGISIFNASESGDNYLSVPGGDPEFTSIRASASRLQPIYGDFALFGLAAGQYAFDTLLSDEQFGVGGIRFGRGYNPEEISRDHGIGFTGELQYTRLSEIPYLERFQLFGFYDYGKAWYDKGDDSDSLSSAGGGARLWVAQNVSMELLVAKPLTRDSERDNGNRDPQILFRTIARF
jgi:hemolysin activation/secretion protein